MMNFVIENKEFVLENEELCIKNKKVCVQNDECLQARASRRSLLSYPLV